MIAPSPYVAGRLPGPTQRGGSGGDYAIRSASQLRADYWEGASATREALLRLRGGGRGALDTLVLATNVDNAWLDWGTDHASPIGEIDVATMRKHLADGQFPAGSMGPKVDAVCSFVEATGGRGIITRLEKITDAVSGKAGTVVVP